MENMMGKADNPLRSILNQASQQFLEKELELWYVIIVISLVSFVCICCNTISLIPAS